MTPDLETMIAAIRRGDLDGLDALQAAKADLADAARKRVAAERQVLAGAAARLAETPDGRTLLDWIVSRTLARVSFLVTWGLPADQVALMGAKREGANELAFEIVRLVAEGRGETLPPRT